MKELSLNDAAVALRSGELVIIPTETVYGLAGDATRPEVVQKIFEAKNRPAGHPLIVHGPSAPALQPFGEFHPLALRAAELWPGPLTLVLKKTALVPDVVTGGQPTVGLRVPNHPVSLALLEKLDFPLAAPSANRFTKLSATRVQDIDPDLAQKVAGVLNGGPAKVGIESTVLDLTDSFFPRILRHGHFTASMLSAHLGTAVIHDGIRLNSPGTHPAHYQPQAKVKLVKRFSKSMQGLCFSKGGDRILMPLEPGAYAARLYAALAEADRMGWATIYIECPPEGEAWQAVWDRLRRAAHSKD